MPSSSRLARLAIVAVLGAAACAGADRPTAAEPSTTPSSPAPATTADEGGDGEEGAGTQPSDVPQASAPTAPSPASAEAAPTAGPTEAPTATAPSTAAPDPTATATAAEGPTPAPGQPCVTGLSGEPTVTTTARADVDGDDADDQVTAYAVDDGARSWFIRVDTAAGESLDSPLAGPVSDDTVVTPIGGADVDGDGRTHELFTVVGAGAATTIVAIHTRVGCELVQITIGEAAATFPVGGSVVNLGGLQCLDTDENGVTDTIVAWTGVADAEAPAGTYDMTGVAYRLSGSELDVVGRRTVRANVAEADFAYAQLSCGGVSL